MKKIWALVFSVLLISCTFSAQSAEPSAAGLDDLDKNGLLRANLLGNEANLIRQFQQKEGVRLLNNELKRYTDKNNRREQERITIEKLRNGEVLVISIPASLLFMPNEIELRNTASKVLAPFKRYLRKPDMYWVILDMHSDNTGNNQYNEELTLERVTSVFDWFADEGCNTEFLFPTASGPYDPLPQADFLSMTNRAKNRRLEIYLVPGKLMVTEAKKGKIAF